MVKFCLSKINFLRADSFISANLQISFIMSASGGIIASGMVGERLAQIVKRSGWKPNKTYVVFGLGKQLVDEGISGAVYVGVLPFESEREARFRAVSQIKRILMNGNPLIIFESEAYEELMPKGSYSYIYDFI